MNAPAVVAVAVLLAAGACEHPEGQGAIAARVGDAVLTMEELDSQLDEGLPSAVAAVERRQLVEAWIDEELFYQEALTRNLERSPRVRTALEASRRNLLIAHLLDAEFDGAEIEVSEAAIQDHYDSHRDDFLLTRPQVRVRHILVGTRRDANARRQALNRGALFEEVARAHSRDQESKYDGGDLGYFTSQDDPVLWEACESLELNSISKPVRTEYGYHIFQLLDRQEAGTVRDLDKQVRAEIVEQLVRAEHQRRLAAFSRRLKESSAWEIVDAIPEETP